MEKIKFNKIQHIGIPVINLQKSIQFYEGLGFENIMQQSFEFDGGKGEVAMMKSGEILIEIYQMPIHILPEIKARKDGKIDHFAIDVDNIDELFHYFKSNGYTVFEAAPVFLPFWKNGCKYFNIAGPDGERIEFNQIL